MKSNALYVLAAVGVALATGALSAGPCAAQSAPAATTAPASAPATAPASQPASSSGLGPVEHILPIGVLALIVWIVSCISRKQNVTLKNTPGRHNNISVLHIVALVLLQILLIALLQDGLHWDLVRVVLPVQIAVLIACLLVAHWLFPTGFRNGMGLNLRHWRLDLLRGVLACLAVLPIVMGLEWLSIKGVHALIHWKLAPQEALKINEMLTALRNVGPGGKVAIAVSAIVMAPLGEEVLFRGLTQSMFRRYLQSPWAAILLTSGFFALMHGSYLQDVVPLFALSIALGYNYERTGRLLPSIVIHALFNGLMVWQFLLNPVTKLTN